MLIQVKCQNCGANIETEDNSKKIVCKYCGSEYVLEDVVNNFQTINQYNTTQNIVKNIYGNDTLEVLDLIKNGDVFISLGEFEKAEKSYTQAINTNPSDWRGWFGLVKVKTKDFSDLEDKTHFEFLSKAKKVATKEQKSEIEELYNEFSLKVEKNKRSIEKRKHEEHLQKQEWLKKQKIKERNKQNRKKKIAIMISAIVAAIILFGVGVFLLVDAIHNDKFFNYEKSDLTKYITLDEKDYKNLTFDVDIAKPKDIEVDVAILSLLAADKGAVRYDGNTVSSAFTITPGTKVNIWYRGYLIDDNGEQIPVDGMSNFTDDKASSLEIGSGSFIPGFELGLVGVNTGDYAKFVKIKDPATDITESHVVYVSYSKLLEGAESNKATKAENLRIKLSDDVDAVYGEGFKAQILDATIGEAKSFSAVIDGETYNYTDVKVNFVTECENNPLVVTTYFPYDYNTTDLRNETAYFEVYVESGVLYEAPPEFDDEFVKNMIEENGGTTEFLDNYEGENLADKYRDYIKKTIDKNYEEAYRSAVSEVVWEHVISSAQVIKYPLNKVKEVYENYVDLVKRQFAQSGGQIQNQYTGEYNTYNDLDTYAVAYLGLSYYNTTDWQSYLYGISQNSVAETLIIYYIADQQNLIPSEEEFETIVSRTFEQEVNEYVVEYLQYENKTRDDFTDEEYEQYYLTRAAELVKYHGGEEYFRELAIYDIVTDSLVEWTNANTLDTRRAYPFDK